MVKIQYWQSSITVTVAMDSRFAGDCVQGVTSRLGATRLLMSARRKIRKRKLVYFTVIGGYLPDAPIVEVNKLLTIDII